MLKRSLVAALRLQMLAARAQWKADRRARRGGVETPQVLKVAAGGTASPLDALDAFAAPRQLPDPPAHVCREPDSLYI